MTGTGGPLIWTRSLEDWSADASLFAKAGLPEPLRLPCIRTTLLPAAVPPAFDVVVFTSRKGVEAFLALPGIRVGLAAARGIYTHGAATAALLQDNNIPVEHIPVATAEALAADLAPRLPRGSRILVPGPETPAFDLAGALTSTGHRATALPLYTTTPGLRDKAGSPFTTEALTNLCQSIAQEGVVCFASPSAIQGWVEGFAPLSPRWDGGLTAVCIGPTTSNAAKAHFPRIVEAAEARLVRLVSEAAALCAPSS